MDHTSWDPERAAELLCDIPLVQPGRRPGLWKPRKAARGVRAGHAKPSHPDAVCRVRLAAVLLLISLRVFNTHVTYLQRCEVWSLVVCLRFGLDIPCEASHELVNSCLGTLVTHLCTSLRLHLQDHLVEANPSLLWQMPLIPRLNCGCRGGELSLPSRQESPETDLGSPELSAPFAARCCSQAGNCPLCKQMRLSVQLLPVS